MRVFIGLTEIAGYYRELKQGFDELGVESTFIDLSDHPFAYGGGLESPNVLVRALRGALRGYRRARSRPAKRMWLLAFRLAQVPVFLWALARFDAFIFGYRSRLLERGDLHLLRMFGRKVVYVFHGSDSRPPYIDGALLAVDPQPTIVETARMAADQRAIVGLIDRHADVVIDHPATSHFHTRPVVSWMAIGIPQRARPADVSASASERRARTTAAAGVRILHAPSQREGKGSAWILEAIRALRARGHAIDFVEISGQPHDVVVAEIERCDFVVDQLFSDTPMAGLATEAAARGKPAVVGGYYARRIDAEIPHDFIPPTLYCLPEQLEAAIERMIVDEPFRLELGRRAYEFVSQRWAPRQVAARYLQLLAGDVPEDWTFDPRTVRYVNGYGLPADRAREIVRRLVAEGGVEALRLDDKPDLVARFLDFAAGEGADPGPAPPALPGQTHSLPAGAR